MQHCISFTPTVQKSLASKNNITRWNEALDYFDKKEYHKSIIAVFDYLDENILKHYANEAKTEITIPQGSAVVIIAISDTAISIKAPFVKLPSDKQLPILRKCAEINFGTLILPQILLEGDVLTFGYSMPVALCEPYKLYDILRDIATSADKYDDEFVSKFGAARLLEPQTTQYADAELLTIVENVKGIAGEALEYAVFFETKRDITLTADAVFIGLNRVKYYANPTGIVSNKINEAIEAFYGRNHDLAGKIKLMRSVLESLKVISTEEARDTFNINFQLIPAKSNASRSYLKDWIAKQHEDAASMYNKEYYSTATSYSLYTLYIILADFNIDDNSRKAIEYTLQQAAGKTWQDASGILMKCLDFFYENEEETLEMETEAAETLSAAATENYMDSINAMMDQYKTMLSGFMKGFTTK